MATKGWESVKASDVADKRVRMPAKARSKYGATPTTVDGIRFHSLKESRRYAELKLLEKAGEIWELELQPEFVLHAPSCSGYLMRAGLALTTDGKFKLGVYRGDFKYHAPNAVPYVVEDVKGFKTPLYRWKKKHVEAQYGIQIREI